MNRSSDLRRVERQLAWLACALLLGCSSPSSSEKGIERDAAADHDAAEGGLDNPPVAGATAPVAGRGSVPDAAPIDAGPDSAVRRPDAMVITRPGKPDTGSGASDPNDAGSDSPADDAGSEPPPCTDRACRCEQLCTRSSQLQCPSDPPLALCVSQCAPTPATCAAESLALLNCQVAQPDSNLGCDPDFGGLLIMGCGSAELALGTCSSAL